jgi:hypothetical protein
MNVLFTKIKREKPGGNGPKMIASGGSVTACSVVADQAA